MHFWRRQPIHQIGALGKVVGVLPRDLFKKPRTRVELVYRVVILQIAKPLARQQVLIAGRTRTVLDYYLVVIKITPLLTIYHRHAILSMEPVGISQLV